MVRPMAARRVPTVTFPVLRGARLFERVIQAVQERIASGALRPGDRLPAERELAEQFQVSRSAVREALRVLERGGAIEIRLGHAGGAFVREQTTEAVTRSLVDLLRVGNVTLDDITRARLGLEGLIIEEVARTASDEDLVRLRESIERATAHLDAPLPEETSAVAENLNFHVLLAEVTGNSVYRMIVEAIVDIMHPLAQKVGGADERTRATLACHRRVAERLAARDAAGARAELERHILEVHDLVTRNARTRAAAPRRRRRAAPPRPRRKETEPR